MLKQQTVTTSLGQLTVSSLTLGELRQLEGLFLDTQAPGIGSLLKYLPIIFASTRKVHQDLTEQKLEDGLGLEDFQTLFSAVLEVSGLKKQGSAGEPVAVPV